MSEARETLQEQEEEKTIPCSASSTTFTSSSDDDDDEGDREIDGTKKKKNKKKKEKNKELDLSFDLAASRVASSAAASSSPNKLSDSDALKLYGFYKQALEGDCSSSRPAIWDRKGRAKWDAWSATAGIPKEEAKKRYVELTEILLGPGEKGVGVGGGGGNAAGGGGAAGAGATTVAAARRATGGAAAGTRFGPVFSTPVPFGEARAAGGDEREAEDEDDEDDVVMCPLSVAAAADDVDAIADLISRGEDPKTSRDGGGATATTTPLHWAADKGALRATLALIDAGAPLDAADADRATPLHYACLCGRKEIAELLVERGADVELVDSEGQRARDKAPRSWGGGWP